MPVKLTGVLQEFGIAAETTESRGWKAFTNGQLVEAAAEAGFTAVITRDRLFAEAAAKALRRFPQLAVVLVRIPQLQGPLFLEKFREEWKRTEITPVAGEAISWPP